LKALEGAGLEHLYGLAPIINALGADRRDLAAPVLVDLDLLSPEEVELEEKQRSRKPEAQFAPYLFIQDQEKFHGGSRKAEKAKAADNLVALATERGVPVAKVDKGVLNTLSGNRPHQGFVLRCGSLFFEPLQFGGGIPLPAAGDTTIPHLWLVLDEVVDPQNFGALLRSAYFLGKQQQVTDDIEDGNGGIGILVCAKNSAPPSPVVSASSAGALELCQIHSTSNLPRTLGSAKEAGWRILGAAAKAPPGMVDDKTGEPTTCLDLEQVLSHENGKLTPTMLVLGSEGHGLRTLVAKACTGFVRIPGSSTMENDMDDEDDDSNSSSVGVDSLNVSVTGGIMLWHLINGMKE
jgi:21S rRNA (GM2251-2'-O)-methyltransferase